MAVHQLWSGSLMGLHVALQQGVKCQVLEPCLCLQLSRAGQSPATAQLSTGCHRSATCTPQRGC